MCGIVGLHLRDPELYPRLGELLTGMLVRDAATAAPTRPASPSTATRRWSPAGHGRVSVLDVDRDAPTRSRRRAAAARCGVAGVGRHHRAVAARVDAEALLDRGPRGLPGRAGRRLRRRPRRAQGRRAPARPRRRVRPGRARRAGRASAHTRMATESAVTPAGCHPYAVGPGPVPGAQRLVRQPRHHPPRAARRGRASSTARTTPRSAPASSPTQLAAGRRPGEGAARSCCATLRRLLHAAGLQPRLVRRGPRRDRLQARGHRRDRRLGGDGLGVPRARRPARRRGTPASASPSRRWSTHGHADRAATLARSTCATTPLREVNAALHAAGPRPASSSSTHPAGAHNVAVGLDAAGRRSTIDGHVGYYAAGMNQQRRRSPSHGNAGTGVAENMMSRHGPGQGQRVAVRRRHRARRPAGDRGRRRCALRHLDEGRRHRRRRQRRPHERVHGAGRAAGRLRRRRRGARRLDLRGPHLRARRRSPRSAPTASRRRCAPSTSRSSPSCSTAAGFDDDPADFTPLRLGPQPLPLPRRQRCELLMTDCTDDDRARLGLRESATFDRADHRRHPARRRDRHLRHPRLGRQARAAALRRPAVPRRVDVALPAGGLPRALRHRRRPRRPAREVPAAPRHPGHHRRA